MKNWTLLGHRSELAKPHDYLQLGGACAYNDNGEIIVTDGLCPHRGTRLFEGHSGNKAWICPYHGWSYSDGKMHIPLTRAFGKDAEWGEPVPFQQEWVGDFLFAKEPGAKPSPLQLACKDMLAAVSKNIWALHWQYVMPMPCPPSVAIENSMEDYHVPMVHRDTFARLGLVLKDMDRFGNNSIAHYEVTDERTVDGLKVASEYFENVKPDEYFHLFIYPYTCISSLGGFTYSVQHYLPASDGNTSLWTRLYSSRTKPESPSLAFLFDTAASFNLRVFTEDAAICKLVSGQGRVLGDMEKRISWYRSVK